MAKAPPAESTALASRYGRRRGVRLSVAALAATLLLLSVGIPRALAASPSNDTISGAKPLSVGFEETLDTTEATTDADDEALNSYCDYSVFTASVWYTFTGTGADVILETEGSSYYPVIIVATGSPGSLEPRRCGYGNTFWHAEAGTTYHLVIADTDDWAGGGGSLHVSLRHWVPRTLSVDVNPTGTVDSAGTATVGGSYTCTGLRGIWMNLWLEQSVGPRGMVRVATEFGLYPAACDGKPHPWSKQISATGEKYAGGKAMVYLGAYGCNVICAYWEVVTEIKLRGGAG